MGNLRKSVLIAYALSFHSFCSAAMFATSDDIPAVTFHFGEQNDIYEGYTFILRASFTGGGYSSWSFWPGYDRCNNPGNNVVGAWSLAIPRKIITNGVTLEVYSLSDGGGGVPSKVIDLGNGKQNMWVFWPYINDPVLSCGKYTIGSVSIGNGTMDLWVHVTDISADHKPGKYSVFIDSEASYNVYEDNISIINNEPLFKQISLSNKNKQPFSIPLNFSTNFNCSVSDSTLLFEHGALKPNEINTSILDKYIELSCSALYAKGRARLYLNNLIGTDQIDLKMNNNEINAKVTIDRTDVSILGGSKEKIKISSQLSKISNRVEAGGFSSSTVLTVEWY